MHTPACAARAQAEHVSPIQPVRRPQGFTLIELLTVIAIVGILATIVLSSIGKVRTTANLARSGAHLRQIVLATLMYADENRGYFPKVTVGGTTPRDDSFLPIIGYAQADIRRSALYTHLGKNPAYFLAPTDRGVRPDGTLGRNFSYSFNFLLNKGLLAPGASNPSGFEQARDTLRNYQIRLPSRKIIAFEEESPEDGFCVWFIDAFTTRYDGRAPFGFADGHVESLPTARVHGNADYCELVPQNEQY